MSRVQPKTNKQSLTDEELKSSRDFNKEFFEVVLNRAVNAEEKRLITNAYSEFPNNHDDFAFRLCDLDWFLEKYEIILNEAIRNVRAAFQKEEKISIQKPLQDKMEPEDLDPNIGSQSSNFQNRRQQLDSVPLNPQQNIGNNALRRSPLQNQNDNTLKKRAQELPQQQRKSDVPSVVQQNPKKGPPIYQLMRGYLSDEIAQKSEDKFRKAIFTAVMEYAEELLDGMRNICQNESKLDDFFKQIGE